MSEASSEEQASSPEATPDRDRVRRRLLARLKHVEPLDLLVAMAAIVIVAALVVAVSVVGWPFGNDPFAPLPDDRSVVVNLAGSFPAEREEPLAGPHGIAIDGASVYVAEADAGQIAVFSVRGKRVGEIILTPAAGSDSAVPTSLAAAERRRVAVVDAVAKRVLVYKVTRRGASDLLFTVGETDAATAPVHPTAVAYGHGVFYVADAETDTIGVYDSDGAFVSSLAAALDPPLGHIGGIAVTDKQLVLTESDRGRVVVFDLGSGAVSSVFTDAYALPRGIVAMRDRVAVAEVLGGAVHVCDATGARTHTIDVRTVPERPPVSPEGVAWNDSTGRLYVTEPDAGRVRVFNVRL